MRKESIHHIHPVKTLQSLQRRHHAIGICDAKSITHILYEQ